MDALPVTITKTWIGLVGIALGALALIGLVLWGAQAAIDIPNVDRVLIFLLSLLAVAVICAIAIVWMHVYSISYITLTQDGLMSVNWKSLFAKQTVQAEWVRVQNVATVESGIFATMLGFGTLIIPTAGTTEALRMTMVPNAEHWQQVIQHYADKATIDGMDT